MRCLGIIASRNAGFAAAAWVCLLALSVAAQNPVVNDSPANLERKMRLLDEPEVRHVLDEAGKGNSYSQLWAGLIYDLGVHVQRDDKTAAQWFQKAADQGSAPAEFYLAKKYWSGSGVKRRTNSVSLGPR